LIGLLPWSSLRGQHYTDVRIYEEQNSVINSDSNAYNSLRHKKELKRKDKNQKGTERREGKERMKVNKEGKRRTKKRGSM
jgi:hypothetical protein